MISWETLLLLHLTFVFHRLSLSIFRHLQRFDISSFQNTNTGVMTEFTVNTRLPVPVIMILVLLLHLKFTTCNIISFQWIQLTHSIQLETALRDFSLLTKNAPMGIRMHCGPRLSSLIRYSVIYDQRDDRVFPTTGILLRTVNEFCGLMGNVHYTSSSGHAEFNLPIYGGIVAQLSGRVGVVRKTSKTRSIPLENLYYCGGPQTLRGFKYGGAGPKIENTPIGASVSINN